MNHVIQDTSAPKIKQRKVLEYLAANGSTLKEAIKQAGYSLAVQEAPTKITKSKTWQELLKEELPDSLLIRKHQEGLEATKVIVSPTEPDREVEDYQTRAKYLDLAYKVKGRLVNRTDLTSLGQPLSVQIDVISESEVVEAEPIENQEDQSPA